MNIEINWRQYAEKVLKNLEKELKKAVKEKDEGKVSELLKDIDRHKEKYKNMIEK